MLNPGIIYMAISVVLFAVAVVVHFHSLHLSLPISSTVTVLAVILPIASFINAFVYPNLLHDFNASESGWLAGWLRKHSAVVMQGCQAIFTTILATLLVEGIVHSPALDCVMEKEWAFLYAGHDGTSIRYVQDTLKCCGFSSVDDRAFPFAKDREGECRDIYGRDLACEGPWRKALQVHSAVDLAVVLVVALMQICGLIMMRAGTRWWKDLRTPDAAKNGDNEEETSGLLRTERAEDDQEAAETSEAGPSQYGGVGR